MIRTSDRDPIHIGLLGPPPGGGAAGDRILHQTDSPAALRALCRRGRVDVALVADGLWPRAEAELTAIDAALVVLRHVPGDGLSASLIAQAAALRAHRRGAARRSLEVDPHATPELLPGESDAMSGLRARLRQVVGAKGVVTIAGGSGTPLLEAAAWLHARDRGDVLMRVDLRDADALEVLMGSPTSLPAMDLAAGGTLVLEHLDAASGSLGEALIDLADGTWRPACDDQPRAVEAKLVATVYRDPALPGSISAAAGIPEGWTSRVVRVPSLGERLTDLPLLVALRHGADATHAHLGVDQEYPWPGNDEELALRCRLAGLIARSPAPSSSFVCDEARSLADLERQAVVATLRSQGGHRRKTAQALGIGLRTLGVKLSQWRTARQLPPGI